MLPRGHAKLGSFIYKAQVSINIDHSAFFRTLTSWLQATQDLTLMNSSNNSRSPRLSLPLSSPFFIPLLSSHLSDWCRTRLPLWLSLRRSPPNSLTFSLPQSAGFVYWSFLWDQMLKQMKNLCKFICEFQGQMQDNSRVPIPSVFMFGLPLTALVYNLLSVLI